MHGPRARTLHALRVPPRARARCMRAYVASGAGNVHVASAGQIVYRLRPYGVVNSEHYVKNGRTDSSNPRGFVLDLKK